MPTKKSLFIDELSNEERQLVIAGLRALRREYGKSWNRDCDIAELNGQKPPSLSKYGIENIKCLARRFGGKALHWSEEDMEERGNGGI